MVSNIFIFTPISGRFPLWRIFFRWVETTNQYLSPYNGSLILFMRMIWYDWCLTWVNPRRNGHWAVGFHVFFDPEWGAFGWTLSNPQNPRVSAILEQGNVSWWYHLPKPSTFSETVWWYLCLVPDLYKELTKKSDDTIKHPHSRIFSDSKGSNSCDLFCWWRFLRWAYDEGSLLSLFVQSWASYIPPCEQNL